MTNDLLVRSQDSMLGTCLLLAGKGGPWALVTPINARAGVSA